MEKMNKTGLNNSYYSYSDERLLKIIESLQTKLEKINNENSELRKINRSLNAKVNLLLNDNNIVKNVKLDMNDYSDFSHFTSEDTLKDFFYLMVLSEKMKYMNIDHIWLIDSAVLYREVQVLDLAFYEWQTYLQQRLNKEYTDYMGNYANRNQNCEGVLSKLK